MSIYPTIETSNAACSYFTQHYYNTTKELYDIRNPGIKKKDFLYHTRREQNLIVIISCLKSRMLKL